MNKASAKIAELVRRLKELERLEVYVGSTGPRAADYFVDRGSGETIDLSVAGMLAAHEYGFGPPERPLLRSFVAAQRPRYARLAGALGRAAIVGRLKEGIEEFGEDQVDELDAWIFVAPLKPLAPATTADPGRDRRAIPLLDTEQIRQSFSYRIGP